MAILSCFPSGGMNLNYKVVAYENELLLPETAKENTIAVITDTPITSYAFAASEPTNVMEGMVWIATLMSSAAPIDVLSKNSLVIYPGQCYQYINGAWVAKIGYTYQNGTWIDIVFGILINGFLNPDYNSFGRKYNSSGGANGSVYYSKGSFCVTAPAATSSLNLGWFEKTIDVTNLSAIQLDLYIRGWTGGWLGLSENPNTIGVTTSDYNTTGWALFSHPTNTSNKAWTGTVTLNVEGMSGSYYLALGCAGSGSNNYTGEISATRIEFIV